MLVCMHIADVCRLVWTTRPKRLHGEKLGLAGQTSGAYDGVVFCAWACAGLLSRCMLPQHRERGHRTNHDCGSDPLCHVRRPVYSGGERDRCHLPLHRGGQGRDYRRKDHRTVSAIRPPSKERVGVKCCVIITCLWTSA